MSSADSRRPERPRRIGIMGGTFDPIHFGHLLAAEEAYSSFGLDEVIFVPTGQPPHKPAERVTSPEDRYAMTLLATLDNDHVCVSRIEIERKGSSHTVDTLKEMRHWYPRGSVEFFFITGLDAVLEILSWKNPQEVGDLCRLVAVSRPGYNPQGMDDLPERVRQAILPLEIPLLAISSTEIRRRVAEGRSIRYLVPPPVAQYIEKKRLYMAGRGRCGEQE